MASDIKSPRVPYRAADDKDAEEARERERRRRAAAQGVGATILSEPGSTGGLGAQTGAAVLGGR